MLSARQARSGRWTLVSLTREIAVCHDGVLECRERYWMQPNNAICHGRGGGGDASHLRTSLMSGQVTEAVVA